MADDDSKPEPGTEEEPKAFDNESDLLMVAGCWHYKLLLKNRDQVREHLRLQDGSAFPSPLFL